jgi:hypothetical protein
MPTVVVVRFRRVSAITPNPDEGLLTEPTPAVRPWSRERVFMPLCGHSLRSAATALIHLCDIRATPFSRTLAMSPLGPGCAKSRAFNLRVENSSHLVSLRTQSAGDDYPKKEIEKTVLRFLGSRTFSHGLGHFETKSVD